MRRALAMGIALVFLLLPQAASSTAPGRPSRRALVRRRQGARWEANHHQGAPAHVRQREDELHSQSENGDAAGDVTGRPPLPLRGQVVEGRLRGRVPLRRRFRHRRPCAPAQVARHVAGQGCLRRHDQRPDEVVSGHATEKRSPGSTSTPRPWTSSSATGQAPRAGSGRRPASSPPRQASMNC